MNRRTWMLLSALVFVLATTVDCAVYAYNIRAINNRISNDRRVLGTPGYGVPTQGQTVTLQCIPNCAADKKVLDALLRAAETKNERAARLDLAQTGKDLATAKLDSYVREAIIVVIVSGIIVAVRLRTGAT